jgi:hypothetical protein
MLYYQTMDLIERGRMRDYVYCKEFGVIFCLEKPGQY